LKLRLGVEWGKVLASPPHGGVWIETRLSGTAAERRASPPHGGVWIETWHRPSVAVAELVTPSRGGVD